MRVTFVELTAFEAILPLASGYMQAYACQDERVRDSCEFTIYSAAAESDASRVLADLTAQRSDVYAFCCYIWNMRLVTSLVERLLESQPTARFILGGPQVMNHAADYMPPDTDRVVICNGEGEKTFHAYIRELLANAPHLSNVPGLSFRDGEEIVTNEPAQRVRDLTEIPSPFAADVFEPGRFTTAILETNRGCPFRCAFCYWGAATNDRVNRFEEERIRSDIEWIADNGVVSLFIVDANWGMLRRDVELTRHIVDCARRTGYPLMVAMASAKNSPDKVAQITETLVEGGLLTSQPISLQTMNHDVLQLIDRANIKYSAYESLQRNLREKGISSYIELIWPLPGETVETFRQGIGSLCRAAADTIIAYPQLLLHNTPLHRDRELLGLQTRRVASDVAEADVVVATNWADEDEYATGIWFFYATHTLYNLRGLYHTLAVLERTGIATYEGVLQSAADFFRTQRESRICAFFDESVRELRNYDFHNNGLVAHLILHSDRAEFDRLLHAFARTQPWWGRDDVRLAFELDLLMRPYIYAEDFVLPAYAFSQLEVTSRTSTGVEVAAASAIPAGLLDHLEERLDGLTRMAIDHPRERKMAFMAQAPLTHNASYCQGMILRMRELLPVVKELTWQIG